MERVFKKASYERKYVLGADRIIFERARELRNKLTNAEILLWEMFLKEKPDPLGFYIADFYCHKLKLVIEVDGTIHEKANVALNDKERQESIEAKGIVVMRFTNDEVTKQLEAVIIKIKEFIHSSQNQDTDKRS